MAQVDFRVADSIATITINRPEARNAVNAVVAQALADMTEEIDRRADIRVAILTGEGGNFCSGLDLKAFLVGENVKPRDRGFAGMTRAVINTPMIAAVEGYALAGGFELALACDLIVAGQGAKFGLPEVRRGLVANAGGLVRLPRQVPYRLALEWALTGCTLSAAQLLTHGLINRVTADGEALAGALELASTIINNAPLAVAASKRVMRESADWPTAQLFTRQDEITLPIFKTEDAREGAKAFAEKRKAAWRGE